MNFKRSIYILVSLYCCLNMSGCKHKENKQSIIEKTETGISEPKNETKTQEKMNIAKNPASIQNENESGSIKSASKSIPKPVEEIKVTFIELGATKCIPCKMMQPIMREIENEYGNEVKVVFHDVWEDREPAERYAIDLIPTQVFLDKDGKEFYRHEGFFTKEEILKVLAKQGVKIKEK